jgi:NADH:ubiquinone oxidoreductase subunit K
MLKKILTNIVTLEEIISIDEKKKLLILTLSLSCFLLICIISFFIIIFFKINIIYFLIILEFFYLGIIILALSFTYFFNIPLGSIYALFILIIAALESILGLSLVLVNKYVFNNIYLDIYNNNRY